VKEAFRLQINFALKILSISVKYGRANAIKKIIESPPYKKLVVDKENYHAAFQIARLRVKEVATQSSLSLGAIKQIDERFEDLIQLFDPVPLFIN
jgi:hypothetical protein